jgi:hypothetical protein
MATNIFSTTLTEGDDTFVFAGLDPRVDIPWTIYALGGNDSVTLNGGWYNICYMAIGDDYVRVNGGSYAAIHGEDGNDSADMYAASVLFDGGGGNDTVNIFGGAHLTFVGGAGSDTVNINADMGLGFAGGEGDDLFSGNGYAISGNIVGGAGDDRFTGIQRADGQALTLEGGSGNDLFNGTMSGLNGVTIADFGVGDRIYTYGSAESFTYSLSGNTLTFDGYSLTFGAPIGGTIQGFASGGRIFFTVLSRDVANDFNGDGRSDILWRNGNTGAVSDWLGQASGGFAANGMFANNSAPLNWRIAGTGDFNGDRRDDILWRNDDGLTVDWLGTPDGGFVSNYTASALNVPTDWTIVGAGDFNGNGRDDILWRDTVSGLLVDWVGQTNGGFSSNYSNSAVQVTLNWSIAATGDFNGDGRTDILWRNEGGLIVDWLGALTGGFNSNYANSAVTIPTDWTVAGAGDFNGDGRDDILWRNGAGLTVDWLANASGNGGFSSNYANSAVQVATTTSIASIGDFNGDGRDDILWRDSSGTLAEWFANSSGGFTDHFSLANVPTAWHVEPQASLV